MSDMIKYSMLVLDMRRTETSQNVRKNACMVQIFNILNSLDLAIFNPYHDWGPSPTLVILLKKRLSLCAGAHESICVGGGAQIARVRAQNKNFVPPPLLGNIVTPFINPFFEKMLIPFLTLFR